MPRLWRSKLLILLLIFLRPDIHGYGYLGEYQCYDRLNIQFFACVWGENLNSIFSSNDHLEMWTYVNVFSFYVIYLPSLMTYRRKRKIIENKTERVKINIYLSVIVVCLLVTIEHKVPAGSSWHIHTLAKDRSTGPTRDHVSGPAHNITMLWWPVPTLQTGLILRGIDGAAACGRYGVFFEPSYQTKPWQELLQSSAAIEV